MPVELRQVEHPLHQSPEPLADASGRDVMAPCDHRDGLTLMDLRYGLEDGVHIVDLAGKQIVGQRTLARSTPATPHQPDPHPSIA